MQRPCYWWLFFTFFIFFISSGNSTSLWKITIFDGKNHYTWPFSIANCQLFYYNQRVHRPRGIELPTGPRSCMISSNTWQMSEMKPCFEQNYFDWWNLLSSFSGICDVLDIDEICTYTVIICNIYIYICILYRRYIYIYMYVYIHTYMYVYIYIYIYMYAYMYTYVFCALPVGTSIHPVSPLAGYGSCGGRSCQRWARRWWKLPQMLGDDGWVGLKRSGLELDELELGMTFRKFIEGWLYKWNFH